MHNSMCASKVFILVGALSVSGVISTVFLSYTWHQAQELKIQLPLLLKKFTLFFTPGREKIACISRACFKDGRA